MENRNRDRNDRYNDSNNDWNQNANRRRDNSGEGYGNYNDRSQDDNAGRYGGSNYGGSNYGGNSSGDNERNWRSESNRNWNDNENDRNRQGSDTSNRTYNSNDYRSNSGYRGEDSFGRGNSRRLNERYGYDRGQDYDSRNRNNEGDRGWWDKTTDEVSSWFGNDEAERRRRMDKMNEGKHKGRGPKGYRRSDDRIKEDVNDRLSDDHYVDASDIDVAVTEGEVTLTGTVDSKETKRRAEDIAEAVSGVINVQNNLRAGKSSNTDKSGAGNTGISSASGATNQSTNAGNALANSNQNGHKSKAHH